MTEQLPLQAICNQANNFSSKYCGVLEIISHGAGGWKQLEPSNYFQSIAVSTDPQRI